MKGPTLGEKPFPGLLEREWCAARLAIQLGLPCAMPLKIRVEPAVAASATDAALRARLTAGPEVLFGSLSAGPGWMLWSDAMSVPRANVQRAAEIYLFDTITQNWDRAIHNPNLLAKGDKLLMIDHGEAFVEATGTDGERELTPIPWKIGGVTNHEGAFEMHPLWPKLRPKTAVSFKDAADRWKALPEDCFDLIAADVPECWDRPAAQRIADYLVQAVTHVNEIVANIEHNLARS